MIVYSFCFDFDKGITFLGVGRSVEGEQSPKIPYEAQSADSGVLDRECQQPYPNLLTVMHKQSVVQPSFHISVLCTQDIMLIGDKQKLQPSRVLTI